MNKRVFLAVLCGSMLMAAGCAVPPKKADSGDDLKAPEEPRKKAAVVPAPPPPRSVPVKDRSGFRLKPLEISIKAGRTYLPVGAEIITRDGKVELGQVVKRMADLRGFSVSWADDVVTKRPVDVHVRPEDNFWEALDNLLRQLDYFYEMDNDTIVVRYKETKRYHLVMPPLKEDFKTSVGGDLIGTSGEEGQLTGKTQITADLAEPMEFWANVNENLQTILNTAPQTASASQGEGDSSTASAAGGTGYFIIDKQLGIITMTAPRATHKQVEEYLANLKKSMYRQVVIEARIVEVELEDSFRFGIDWSNLLSRTFQGSIGFGDAAAGGTGNIYPYRGMKFINAISLNSQQYSVMMEALKEYGKTNVLSNPKITLMNGHGASITVGENRTYVDRVESTTDETGNVTFTVTTGSVLSGLGLAVMANIINDKEVILYLVPVTSELQEFSVSEAIEYRRFGTAEVGLPIVKLRELSTMARVKDGETLIIGGHISKTNSNRTKSVPLLGDIPGFGWFFRHKDVSEKSIELVIFLQPKIISSL